MKRYNSVNELVNAKAKKSHRANLLRGGVYKGKKRYSNIETERNWAKSQVRHVPPRESRRIIGVQIRKPTVYIKGVGYAPLKSRSELR